MEIVSKERIHLLLDTRRLYCATFSSTLSFKLHDIFPSRVQKSKISSHSKLCRRLFDSQKTHAPFFFHAFFVHSATKPLRNHEDGGISGEFQQRQLTEALRRVYLVRDKGYKIRWWRGEDDSRCVVEDTTSSSARNLVGTSHRLASPRLSFLTSFRRTLHHQSPPYPTAFTGNEKRRYPDGRFNFPAGFIRPIYPSITRPIKNARAFVRIHHRVDPFIIFTASWWFLPPCKGRNGHDSRSFLEKEEKYRIVSAKSQPPPLSFPSLNLPAISSQRTASAWCTALLDVFPSP